MEVSQVTMAKKEREVSLHGGVNFSTLPEGCISEIIALTTPMDAFRLALVSKAFKSASESDATWKRFLPADCDLIVARSDGGEEALAEYRSKKQLYMRLVDHPLLSDGGTKSFWLHKPSGKKCWIIAARNIYIKGSDSSLAWHWTSIPESRFSEVAELLRMNAINIRVNIHTSMLSPETHYAAYLVFKMTENAFGLNIPCTATVLPPRGNGKCRVERRIVYLSVEYEQLQVHNVPSSVFGDFITVKLPSGESKLIRVDQCPKPRTDGWTEVMIGEFFTRPGEEGDTRLYLIMKDENWRSGLVVEGIEVRPAATSIGLL